MTRFVNNINGPSCPAALKFHALRLKRLYTQSNPNSSRDEGSLDGSRLGSGLCQIFLLDHPAESLPPSLPPSRDLLLTPLANITLKLCSRTVVHVTRPRMYAQTATHRSYVSVGDKVAGISIYLRAKAAPLLSSISVSLSFSISPSLSLSLSLLQPPFLLVSPSGRRLAAKKKVLRAAQARSHLRDKSPFILARANRRPSNNEPATFPGR